MKKRKPLKKASKRSSAAKSKTKKQGTKKTQARPAHPTKGPVKKKSKKVKKNVSDVLVQAVIMGIEEKKGENIISLNLSKINSSVCNYFVICEANSNIQVDAIAQSVEETVRKNTGQKPYHSEGYENAEWILIDYVDVVVHVFQRSVRGFYRLEDLWADAEIKHFN